MSDVGCNEPLKVKDKYVYLDLVYIDISNEEA